MQPIYPVSHLLGEAVQRETRPADRVLDMGTGSGVNAILAAKAARRVVAVDVNPVAVATARENAARNGVTVDVRESDVFERVPERFDLIVFDPPFRWFAPRDLRETAITDENYRALTTFFAEVDQHLTPDGRILLFFGTSGDAAYLDELTAGFKRETVASASLERDGWTVEYFTLRLQRQRVRPTSSSRTRFDAPATS